MTLKARKMPADAKLKARQALSDLQEAHALLPSNTDVSLQLSVANLELSHWQAALDGASSVIGDLRKCQGRPTCCQASCRCVADAHARPYGL